MLYRSLLRPILFRLPPETAHEVALHSLSITSRFTPSFFGKRFRRRPFGELKRFGLTFSNPVGLAAGFDKDGIALHSLCALGFGFVEAGTVTQHAQTGNERPRLFRLPADKALINRAGFNNHGAAAFAARVSNHKPGCVLGVSIGKSKTAPMEDAIEDYLASFELVYPVADYVAVNVSSPNTPRLRELQESDQLDALLAALQKRNVEIAATSPQRKPLPVLVKLSPDLGRAELADIVAVAQRNNVAGLIATNTTVGRAGLQTTERVVQACGPGGLSGAPLRRASTEMIATLFTLTKGTMPLIGVGGIFTAADAWEKICAGASLVQLYTGLIYEGPAVARTINDGLAEILKRSDFDSLDAAVGSRAHDV
ncbi:MAG: dihydroorotate dehydrogenase [Blastocatellia bacterium]|jgi:dihydroorotate dehydrogenase|nr:dihydroorotate dehydrogenase [Blastocatellia bacterium]